MNDHHFERMSEFLVRSGVVPEDRRADAKAALEAAWQGQIAISWSLDDVQDSCPGLTEEEAEEVLEEVLQRHDVATGVNWDVIEIVAIGLFGKRALEESEDEDSTDES